MKINRKDLKWFMSNIRRNAERDEIEVTDEYLVNELANYMEVNPACVDMNQSNREGRYSYSCVGYGVFSLMGERYRMGRVEIFDQKDDSGYAIDEGSYCMPFESANQFENFIENIQTDLPINIEMGKFELCRKAAAEDLGIDVDKLNDAETKRAFYKKKNDEYAQTQGFKDWDSYLDSTELGRSLKTGKDEKQ